jgi:ribosome modulation factor
MASSKEIVMRMLILVVVLFCAGCGGNQAEVKERAFHEGHKVGKAGQPPTANPYNPVGWEHEGWMKGWTKGDAERREEEKKNAEKNK